MENNRKTTERSKNCSALLIRQAAEKWPSTFIARKEVEAFSGGAIAHRTLANLDSLGIGIPNRFRVSRKICYPIADVADWLISRLSEV